MTDDFISFRSRRSHDRTRSIDHSRCEVHRLLASRPYLRNGTALGSLLSQGFHNSPLTVPCGSHPDQTVEFTLLVSDFSLEPPLVRSQS